MLKKYSVVLNNKIRKFFAVYNCLKLKERSLIFFTVIIFINVVWYVASDFLIYNTVETTKKDIKVAQDKLDKEQDKFKKLNDELKKPDVREKIKRLKVLEDKYRELSLTANEKNYSALSSDNLSKILHSLLTEVTKVKMVSFNSFEKVGEIEDAMKLNNSNKEKTNIINNKKTDVIKPKHAELYLNKKKYYIHLRGKYFDILDYLKLIESKNLPLFWYKIDYKVSAYPEANAEIYFYTINKSDENDL